LTLFDSLRGHSARVDSLRNTLKAAISLRGLNVIVPIFYVTIKICNRTLLMVVHLKFNSNFYCHIKYDTFKSVN
jgi:hypothetical protein